MPTVLAGREPLVFDGKQSGRLELARWLVQPDHPLTGRVMVNRIWRWHFGQGIVRTPDNFGRLGERPEQSDCCWTGWRTASSTAAGRSRRCTGSSCSPAPTSRARGRDARALESDPENRLHWRANVRAGWRPRRFAMRCWRSAARSTRRWAGSLLHVKNRAYLFDHTSKDTTRYDSRRRSLYLPVIRNNVYDVFQLFDFPDPAVPSGDRATTTVAPQALFLMNSDWVGRLCDSMAEGLLKDQPQDDSSRVRLLYRIAYGREATAQEIAAALTLLRDIDRGLQTQQADPTRRQLQVWANLCQVTLAANEFLYIQ